MDIVVHSPSSRCIFRFNHRCRCHGCSVFFFFSNFNACFARISSSILSQSYGTIWKHTNTQNHQRWARARARFRFTMPSVSFGRIVFTACTSNNNSTDNCSFKWNDSCAKNNQITQQRHNRWRICSHLLYNTWMKLLFWKIEENRGINYDEEFNLILCAENILCWNQFCKQRCQTLKAIESTLHHHLKLYLRLRISVRNLWQLLSDVWQTFKKP